MIERTVEDLRESNVPSQILLAAVAKRCFHSDASTDIEKRHDRAAYLAGLRHLMPLQGKPIPEVEEEDIYIEARDGHKLRVRLYTPVGDRKLSGGGPLILMFHEGGFTAGDLTDEELNCRLFSREFGAVCGNVEYRLAPEAYFPTWINDCIDVTKRFSVHFEQYGTAPQKGFIVGGSSAGGNIAAVLAQLSRLGEFSQPITGQYLSVPLIAPLHLFPEEYESFLLSPYESTDDPVLRYVGAERLKGLQVRLKVDEQSNLFSPLAPPSYPPDAAKDRHALAPAYMQVAGLDPLRDHALVYDRILRSEYGVQTKVDLYHGFGHMFWTNWPELAESHAFIDDTVRGIKWLLDQGKSAHQ